MRTTTQRLAVVAAACLSVLTAACGSDDTGAETPPATTSTPAPTTTADAEDEATADLVGPGCADYAAAVPDGRGSFVGMAQDPVATAVTNNPLLRTLTAAISGQINLDVDLVDVLNGGEFTVFAPVDDAFAQLPADTAQSFDTPKGAELLDSILTYHVVPGRIAPDDITGTQETLNSADLKIKGSGDDLTVGTDGATVVCGGITTANATVYLVDAVLMPPE